ncbi:MAG: orotate phosphoribosyltransferase [Chitinophagales bacterium]|nr:orotate phosphoribosyltransferase [Chitinophagales bacterium]
MSIAQQLLKIQAVKLSPAKPFIWASGAESPIYCDNRITLSFPEVRSAICDGFVAKIKEQYPDAETIAGVATGGIAHGMLVADRLGLPFVYVRDKPKAHGRENTVEGYLEPNAKVVIIEDLISTGGSSLKAVEALRNYGSDVMGLLAIFTYNFQKAREAFDAANCKMDTLTGFKELITLLEKDTNYSAADMEYMKNWYQKGI